ncbi:hypothetical protein LEP1GSC076_0482 [Leptospira sp. Fiocruz LV4135]|nr:hypothetical protein LEP1GSC076_0482 [Leptospira sp. Fiocruz LV4135]
MRRITQINRKIENVKKVVIRSTTRPPKRFRIVLGGSRFNFSEWKISKEKRGTGLVSGSSQSDSSLADFIEIEKTK